MVKVWAQKRNYKIKEYLQAGTGTVNLPDQWRFEVQESVELSVDVVGLGTSLLLLLLLLLLLQ